MQDDSLEELHKGFIEAIAAHKFMESKFGINRSVEINKLKQQWTRIKQSLIINAELYIEPKSVTFTYQEFESQLLQLEWQLESTKIQLLEQQKTTNELMRQNSMALKQIQELKNSIITPYTLEFTTLNDID